MQGELRFLDILRAPSKHDVEFIFVGGVAATFEGAPVSMFDLDIMHRRESSNHNRLMAALKELGDWVSCPK